MENINEKIIEGDSSSDEEGWMEIDDESENTNTNCLFCSKKFKNLSESLPEAIEHLKETHGFDLRLLKSKFNMDQYSFIKMINYIRMNENDAIQFTKAENVFWDDPKYLKPVKYEEWLTIDFDDVEVEETNQTFISKSNEDQIKELSLEIKEKDELLQQAMYDIQRLKQRIKDQFETDNQAASGTLNKNSLRNENYGYDDGYFHSYAHHDIHHDMLNDRIRTDAYRNAISKNADLINSKIVMDLGCGTSILSLFAVKAGAEMVISIDQSDIIHKAMDIARKNNIKNINFVKGRIEDTEIPVEKVDVIISEWMGYFLLFEGMLDSVIYARDNHLKSNGLLFPNYCNLSIVGYGNEKRYNDVIKFWDNVYGFDMSCLKSDVLCEPAIEICDPMYILTDSNVIAEFDLMTVDYNYSTFSYNFNLSVLKGGQLTSIVGYFDTIFKLPNQVEFTTSPTSTPTHWRQVIFYLKDSVTVASGDTINGTINCRRDPKDARSLIVKIGIFGQTQTYNLN